MTKLLVTASNILLVVLIVFSTESANAEDSAFSQAELDQMVAPIALYPDSLLSQILMASTYPADVDEAVAWSKKNSGLEGDAAVEAVQDKKWDPSVMSLVAFPQVLEMMGKEPDWVQNLGDAFLDDSNTVMDTVQKLRKKANDEGNLETTKEQKVIVKEKETETIIVVEPADPKVVYVPVYNPTVVYGTWWWPHYTPWYYYPPGYGFGSAVMRGIGFGIGIGITNALWGGCRWGGRGGHNDVNINVNKYNNINVKRNKLDVNSKKSNWQHNSNNRRGVPYKDKKSRDKYGKKRSGAEQRKDYRGRDAQRDKARATLDRRAVDPAKGRQELRGSGGDKARASVKNANRELSQGKFGGGQAQKQHKNLGSGSHATKQTHDFGNRSTNSRNNAFKGVGNAQNSHKSIQRGQKSFNSMQNRGGGGHRAGGGGHRAGGGGRRR